MRIAGIEPDICAIRVIPIMPRSTLVSMLETMIFLRIVQDNKIQDAKDSAGVNILTRNTLTVIPSIRTVSVNTVCIEPDQNIPTRTTVMSSKILFFNPEQTYILYKIIHGSFFRFQFFLAFLIYLIIFIVKFRIMQHFHQIRTPCFSTGCM